MKNEESPYRASILQCILWFVCIPQTILLYLNIRAWTLISEEADNQAVNSAVMLISVEITILLASFAAFLLYRHRAFVIGPFLLLIALVAHAGYMFLFLGTINDVIPNTIQPWILSEGNVGRWNITLFMPGAFIALYALTKVFFSRQDNIKSRLITYGLIIAIPLLWYLFASLMQPTFLGQYNIVIWIIVGTVLVILFLGAIINTVDNLIQKDFTNNLIEKHYVAVLILGIAAPLAGLYLNRTIPFPVDFQSTGVYLLTILNGVILLLKPGDTRYLSIKYFLRCASFPFIIYFFLVFLPFLPLSLFAIIIMGAGFLMLAPLVLGLFQFRVTFHEYMIVKNKSGKKTALAITLSGLVVLPTCFIVDAAIDKQSLNNTISYFYSHDFDGPVLSDSQIKRSTRALIQLRDRKADIQLPYISAFYNTVVFGDMVLPNSKISQIYQWLTNEEMPEYKHDILGRGTANRRAGWFPRANLLKPETNVTIDNLEQIAATTNKTTVRLTLQNHTSTTHSLFIDQLHIPEGVFVTGLRLKIGSDWVDGRVFDKKTALWVFQKITEVRRDPAIIYYKSPTTLELRVYPFPANGIREVELGFQYHSEIDATVKIGGQAVDLNPRQNTPSIVTVNGKKRINSSLPDFSFQREPYLHVILDFSTGSKLSNNEYVNNITTISNELGIDQVKIVAANLSSSDSDTDKLINAENRDALESRIKAMQLPERGGLWVQQALANEILRVNQQLTMATFTRTPVFVIIQGEKTIIDEDIDVNNWSWLIPDMTTWYAYQKGKLSGYSFYSGKKIQDPNGHTPILVVALKQDNTIKIFPANTSSICDFYSDRELLRYSPFSNRFETVPIVADTSEQPSNWATYADYWNKWKTVNTQPFAVEAQREHFLQMSRSNNLLLPSTALIVVESASQWKILERKEEQSINNHSALNFEEEQQTSEPSWWILLLLMLLFIFIKDKRRRLVFR